MTRSGSTAVAQYLRGRLSPWLPEIASGVGAAPRRGERGAGEVRGVPETLIHVSGGQVDFVTALDTVLLQARSTGAALSAAWVVRPGAAPDHWPVVLDGGEFVDLLLPYLGADVPPLIGGDIPR
jgi:hypothetical protein